MNQQDTQQARDTIIVPINVAMLFSKPPDWSQKNDERPSRLVPSVVNDSRITITVHNTTNGNYENISFTYYLISLQSMFDFIIADEVGDKEEVEYTLHASKTYGGGTSEGELILKRTSTGLWKLLLNVPQKSKVVFPFTGIHSTNILKNGQSLTPAQISKYHMTVWFSTLLRHASNIISHMEVANKRVLPARGESTMDVSPAQGDAQPKPTKKSSAGASDILSDFEDDIPF